MRILELNTERTWRGGERQTIYDVLGYKLQGNESLVICRKNFPLAEHCKQNNLNHKEITSTRQLIWFLMFKSRKFDIIHCQTSKTQQMAVLTKWFHGRKVVYTRRLDFVPKGFFSILKYKWTTHIVAITPAIKKILEQVGIKKITVISEVVEQKELNKKRAQEYLASLNVANKKIIGTTAAFVQHKDPLTMVKAIHMLSKIRQDFIFIHFGDGVLLPEVKKAIASAKLESFYHLAGFMQNVEDMFSVFDVFAMSSEEEGLGSSVLDAFMYKVPVVSTNAGGLADVIGENGLLCNVKDHEALAKNMDKILSDQNLRNELTEKAFKQAKENHSLETISKHYADLFSSLLS
ncbi:MAG TPA: glycosyltransferase family 4 protein [Flavobacteriales bacterium]|nr:glycosyltransferase family 4 protein [Flavobacteriales bacterium]